MSRWSLQAVEKAAPDAASLTAARKLATPGPWSETGSTDALVWGKCQGSGRTPYQVSIDLAGPAYRCSCPSRKFPCKHALALLLLWVRGDGTVGEADAAADFAGAWAQQRAGRAAATAAEKAAKPADPEARARRLAERRALMDAGVDDFALWLQDLVRGGAVEARRHDWSWWDRTAARLVDAQLPGLAERVRAMGSDVRSRGDWAEHLLVEVGQWWTAIRAWRGWDHLDEPTRGDLRALLGWAVPSEEVRAGETVTDRWQVLGAHRTDDGRLVEQRTWLRGETTGETVRLLDFAARAQPLPVARLAGSVLEAEAGLYPGHRPRRAALVDEPVAHPDGPGLGPASGLEAAWEELTSAWAENPWLSRVPAVVRVSARPARGSSPAYVVDAEGAQMPLAPDDSTWTLLALTGGSPTTLFGELDATSFRPLTVELDDGLVPL